MFSICKQSHEATGVEFTVTCRFFNTLEENIVTAGANILKVFRIIPDVPPNCTDQFTDARPPKMRLECMQSYQLHGNVMSLQSVSLAHSQRDALLISFKDAKLSVVQHDPDTFDLKTLSLHYYEEDDIKGGWTGNYHIPIVRVDPDNRCAVMVCYGRKLVVLPFRRDHTLEELELMMPDVKPMKKLGGATQLVAKTPILASYIITLKDLDEKIDNVIDVQFLHGYYEPTLLIVYEPVRTFPGRIAVRTDTCTMVAISLNIQQRVHPVIWTVTGLPFDCTQVLAVRKPIGGCLVVSINALIYLNQSVPPYGVSLNSTADHCSNFPLKPQDGVNISLDAAQIAFIEADKLVMSLRDGELYVLTLCADSMRSIRNFHFSKAAASVLSSCICVCSKEYLFLGSRLGNSIMLRLTENDQNTIIIIDDGTNTTAAVTATAPSIPSGQSTTVDANDAEVAAAAAAPAAATAAADQQRKRMEVDDELEVYGTGQAQSVHLTSYQFVVCDTIMNIGPISHMALGERYSDDKADQPHQASDDDDDDDATNADATGNGGGPVGARSTTAKLRSDLEIVTSSGHGKNGSLCVLQNSIKLHTITSFRLLGCRDVWTLYDESQREDKAHAFMVLSQHDQTTVLRTGVEINEVDDGGFCFTQRTICVGNLGNNRYIAQVLSNSIRLLQGTRLLHTIQVDSESRLVLASICDPYVCVKTESGKVLTLALRETRGAPRLGNNKHTISDQPLVIGLCAYRDASGMFSSAASQTDRLQCPGLGYMKAEPSMMKIEDEEDLLYGESGNAFKVTSMVELAKQSKNSQSEWWRRHLQPAKATYWLFVTRDNGNMEAFVMPDMKLVYIVQNVGNGAKVLTDAIEFVQLQQQDDEKAQAEGTSAAGATTASTQQHHSQHGQQKQQLAEATLPREILLVGLGNNGTRPMLFIRTNAELLVYRAFRYPRGKHLKIRFRKQSHDILWPRPEHNSMAALLAADPHFRLLRYFDNVAGHAGVMVCGDRPHMVLLTARGELRAHRFAGRTAMRSFTAFNNVNCASGLIYLDRVPGGGSGAADCGVQIAVLPAHLTYDACWPMRKVPLRCTPAHVVYHKEMRVYCMVTDAEEVSNKYYVFNGEDKELTEENKGERFLYPSFSRFQVQLVSPQTWELVPKTSIELDEWEHVIAFKNVHLAYEGTRSGFKEYICVGTNYNYSEDITSRGRILLYDIIEVVPEPDAPLTRYKLKEIYKKEQKGPVTAITHVVGFLVTAVGQKIYLWQLKDNDLIGVAFIDTNIYVHQMVSIKSLILVADVYKSVSLLRFQEEFRTLSLVSRDYNMLNVLDIEFSVDNANLGFIASDCAENIIVFMYQPEVRESYGGQRLMRKSDYHVGQRINTMFRVQCNKVAKHWNASYDAKHATFFATLDGGVGYCLPLPEKTYRRLFMLQNVLQAHIEHLCGLNPKSFRTVKSQKRVLSNPSRGIVDGELVWSFLYLPVNEKLEVATKIGARIDEIVGDLQEIANVTAVF